MNEVLHHTTSARALSRSLRKLDSSSRPLNVSLQFSAEFARLHFCAVSNHLLTSSSLTDDMFFRHFVLHLTERNWVRHFGMAQSFWSAVTQAIQNGGCQLNVFGGNFVMIFRWRNYLFSVCLTSFCTWVISQGSGEKVYCRDLLLGQYPFQKFCKQ